MVLLSLWPSWTAGPPRAPWWGAPLPPSLPAQRGGLEKASCSLCPLLLPTPFFLACPSFWCPSHLCIPCVFLPPTSPLPRVFVPSFTYRVSAQLVCVGGRGASACPLTLRLRPKAPPLHNSSSVACGGASVCQLELALPPWGRWVYVRVETPSRGSGRTVRFQLCVRLQGQKPHICPSHPACVDIHDWEEAGMVAVSNAPVPHPYNLPDPTPAPSHSLKASHWKASGHFPLFGALRGTRSLFLT